MNNHLRFKILYHPFDSSDDDKFDQRDTDGNYIVGFQVLPKPENRYCTASFRIYVNTETRKRETDDGKFDTSNRKQLHRRLLGPAETRKRVMALPVFGFVETPKPENG